MCLGVLYSFAALWGVRSGLLPRGRELSDLVLALGAGVSAVLLIDADARLRGKPLPTDSRWLLVPVWPAALAIYAIVTRKARGLGIALKHVVLAYAMFFAAGFTARWLVSHFIPTVRLP